jgi:hypothetical protein
MTLDQKYFFWGCGQPTQFGLYSPVMDRLVCVDDNYQVFEYVVFLLSSKIRLLIVPLHHAPNFKIDLVDNTCCSQWSITNWPRQSLNSKFGCPITKENFFFDTCGDLVSKPNKNLIDIQNFILLSCHVLKLFKFSRNCQYRIFSNLIELPFHNYEQIKQIEFKCNQIIYLYSDYAAAKEKIEPLCNLAETLLCNL